MKEEQYLVFHNKIILIPFLLFIIQIFQNFPKFLKKHKKTQIYLIKKITVTLIILINKKWLLFHKKILSYI